MISALQLLTSLPSEGDHVSCVDQSDVSNYVRKLPQKVLGPLWLQLEGARAWRVTVGSLPQFYCLCWLFMLIKPQIHLVYFVNLSVCSRGLF